MCDKTAESIPQVSVNLTTDSDRVRAPVVGAGPTDSGEGQSHTDSQQQADVFVFAKSTRIARSPIRQRAGSLGDLLEGGTRSDKACKPMIMKTQFCMGESQKRSREEDVEKDFIKDLQCLVDRLLITSNGLIDLININVNTKGDIKQKIRDVKRMADVMKRRIEEEKEKPPSTKAKLDKKEEKTKQTAETGTQTMSKQQEKSEQLKSKINNFFLQNIPVNELEDILKEEWPEESFQFCQVQNLEDITSHEEDIVVIRRKSDRINSKEMRDIVERDPQLKKIIKESTLEVGKTISSIMKNRIIKDDNECSCITTYTHLITLSDEDKIMPDEAIISSGLTRILEMSRKKDRTKIACVATQGINVTLLRNILECTFRKENFQATLYRQKHREPKMKRKIENKDTIILKPLEGISYTQVIKNMKNQVGTDGITIDRVSKRNDGCIHLRIKGKEEKHRKEFKDSLTNKLGNMAVINSKEKTQTVMLLDIDETVEEYQIQDSITTEMNLKEKIHLKLSEKINKDGFKHAFVTVTESCARELITRKVIGKGWNRWRTRELISPPKCFRCHRVGHMANQCTKKDNEELCHKCGEAGHIKRNCDNDLKCYLCMGDHAAETMRCPEFRKLVQQHKMEKTGQQHRL